MLVGDTDGLPDELTRLSTTGLLRDWAPRLIEQWIDAACAASLLAASADQYRTLTLTPLGRAVMAGRVEEVWMFVPSSVASGFSRTRPTRASRAPRRVRRRSR